MPTPQRTPPAYAAELVSGTDLARGSLVITESGTSYEANSDHHKPGSEPIVVVAAVSRRLRRKRPLRLRSLRITLAQTCQPICEVTVAIEFGATDAKQPAPR